MTDEKDIMSVEDFRKHIEENKEFNKYVEELINNPPINSTNSHPVPMDMPPSGHPSPIFTPDAIKKMEKDVNVMENLSIRDGVKLISRGIEVKINRNTNLLKDKLSNFKDSALDLVNSIKERLGMNEDKGKGI